MRRDKDAPPVQKADVGLANVDNRPRTRWGELLFKLTMFGLLVVGIFHWKAT